MGLNELTIEEVHEGYRRHRFKPSEVLNDILAEVSKKNSCLNAYLEIFDDVIEQGIKADEILENSEEIPSLFGIPIAVKDNILIKGKNFSAGSKILKNYQASFDAGVIKKLKNHGAIFLGRTNMDEFAMGSSTENSAYGPSKNPYDENYVPGGSSGGSAAAVAADISTAALGSDTGGSIREPASFCGVVGLKPTYGNVSRHGLIAMASSLDQIGPLTKTVQDSKILFEAISGPDEFDATSSSAKIPEHNPIENIKGIKIGVPREYFAEGLDIDISACIKKQIFSLQEEGAVIKEINLPRTKYSLPCYYIIVPSEISSNLARFDGIRYGSKTEFTENLFDVFANSRAEYLGNEVKRRIMLGTFALSAGYYDAYYLKAQKVRKIIRTDFENAFKEVDIIIGPTTPSPAFPLGERTKDPLKMYLGDIYTVAVNLAGLPAISIPGGFVNRKDSKLPFGIQLIAPWFQENRLFEVGGIMEKMFKL